MLIGIVVARYKPDLETRSMFYELCTSVFIPMSIITFSLITLNGGVYMKNEELMRVKEENGTFYSYSPPFPFSVTERHKLNTEETERYLKNKDKDVGLSAEQAGHLLNIVFPILAGIVGIFKFVADIKLRKNKLIEQTTKESCVPRERYKKKRKKGEEFLL